MCVSGVSLCLVPSKISGITRTVQRVQRGHLHPRSYDLRKGLKPQINFTMKAWSSILTWWVKLKWCSEIEPAENRVAWHHIHFFLTSVYFISIFYWMALFRILLLEQFKPETRLHMTRCEEDEEWDSRFWYPGGGMNEFPPGGLNSWDFSFSFFIFYKHTGT